MKAPDKIYVDDLAVVNDCSTRISTKPLSDFSEYIRKDALMEWLNKKLQESADRLDFHANQAYAEVIDKLNSL